MPVSRGRHATAGFRGHPPNRYLMATTGVHTDGFGETRSPRRGRVLEPLPGSLELVGQPAVRLGRSARQLVQESVEVGPEEVEVNWDLVRSGDTGTLIGRTVIVGPKG